jgi:toxin CcdB
VRHFDVFPNPSNASREFAPFVVVLQSHHIALDTVLVAPLTTDKLASNVEIGVSFQGQALVLAITEMGSVLSKSLRGPVGALAEQEDDIRRALDRLFSGF